MKKCVFGVIVFLVAGALTAFASAGSDSETREVKYIINGSGVVRLVEVGTSPKQKHDICRMLETVEAEAAEGPAYSHSFDIGTPWGNLL